MKKPEKTTFTSKIQEKEIEFNQLLNKFNSIVDPIERYIKRLEMVKLQEWLLKYDVHVDVP